MIFEEPYEVHEGVLVYILSSTLDKIDSGKYSYKIDKFTKKNNMKCKLLWLKLVSRP